MATNLRVTELDFDTIKSNLREFLRAKPEFTDYDFEGSGLSVLLDLLAYNTHYNAVIGNMLIQELYLDTAVKKQSLSLIAKRLGYLPKSYRAPKAKVTLEVFVPTPTPPAIFPDTLTINKNSRFTTGLSFSESTSFVTRDTITTNKTVDNRYIFDNIDIYEGNNSQFRYLVTDPATQRFEIPSTLVDTSLLRVYVQENLSSTDVQEWINFNSIIDIDSETKAYFIKLNENLLYEVYFGDGVLGKQIVAGNVVVLDYVTTNGPVANGASEFTFADSVQGYTNVVVTTTVNAFGGSDPESLDSIRTNAQNVVLAQNRAVTEKDYASIISNLLPVETISVYGGETVNPPQYGKVFISLKQLGTTQALTEQQKEDIISNLRKKSVLSLLHEFIEPEYIYLSVSTAVRYDQRRTTLSSSSMKTKVIDSLKTYATNNLNKFDSTFQYSNLVSYIDDIDDAIISNDTTVYLRKETTLINNVNYQYVFDFYTPIKPSNSKEENVISSFFVLYDYPSINVFLTDVDGKINVYYYSNNVKTLLIANIGTVDYTTGRISFTMNAAPIANNVIKITVLSSNKNVVPSKNNILTLLDSDINVTLSVL